ncbi:DUF421 domain-containing protein [Salirhabdus salicampi]|uniref:DUF421 domain-containing protein n=1 Tax=Salirhabdus salicampi TaxID=476102 RepID=UPI0020C57B0C|nr:DUF421 domain-containing protein [Salirhabdus salicampi]MCP8615608.1 DUF421 domain-containing protein [Salirhabdus salicampi]
MDYTKIFVETLVGFVALFGLTKLLGKSQITQITAFDFIAALVLGELVGNALYDDKAGIREILFAVALWGGLLYTTELITQKFKKTRAFLEGRPAIVINKGEIKKDVLKQVKLDMSQLLHLLRSKNVFSIRDVEFAVFETDGTISVLKNSRNQTPTRDDLHITSQPATLPYSIILDGEIVRDNLKEVNLTEEDVKKKLEQQNIKDYKQVMFAEWKEGEGLYVEPY